MSNEIVEQVVTTVIVAVVSGLLGWLTSSFRMTPRGEFVKRIHEISERLREIETEQKDFVTRQEFRDQMQDLRTDLHRQHEQLSEQLSAISAALITRRNTQG